VLTTHAIPTTTITTSLTWVILARVHSSANPYYPYYDHHHYTQSDLGELGEAASQLESLLDDQTRTLGRGHADTLITLGILGRTLIRSDGEVRP
jgi:hypothetical protein